MIENVCKFLPKFENYNFFNAINLVYETKAGKDVDLKIRASYRMHIICEGEGFLVSEEGSHHLKKGDIVVTAPAVPFAICNSQNLKYIYISFLGIRANMLFDAYATSKFGAVFHGYDHLIPLWQSALSKHREIANIFCEGVVICTFAEIGNESFIKISNNESDLAANKTKEYIDAHFTENSLDVKTIADTLSYNAKYLSTAFKKEFKVNIVDYIRTLRVQHACNLMEQGNTYIKSIAALSGYDNPLYFSAVFKEIMGMSPTQYVKSLKK